MDVVITTEVIVEQVTSAVIYGLQTVFVSVWEEIYAVAYKI